MTHPPRPFPVVGRPTAHARKPTGAATGAATATTAASATTATTATTAATAATAATASAAAALLALLALAWTGPSPAHAQVVRGHVVDDSTEVGLEDVVVTILRDSVPLLRVTTDTSGYFRFELSDSATVQLEGRRLGWRTVLSQPLHVLPEDTVEVELWMGIHAIPVAPLYVTARSNLGRSRFYRHMEEWGKGVFFTPETIDSIAPIHPIDVLRGQDETWLTWGLGQRGPVPRLRTFLGRGCVSYMIDGRRVRSFGGAVGGGPSPVTIAPDEPVPLSSLSSAPGATGSVWEDSDLELLEGRHIVAAEFFRYIGEVPPELRRHAGGESMCGLVVFWTNRGW